MSSQAALTLTDEQVREIINQHENQMGHAPRLPPQPKHDLPVVISIFYTVFTSSFQVKMSLLFFQPKEFE